MKKVTYKNVIELYKIPTEQNRVSPIEKYLHHLKKLFGREPDFFKNESKNEGIPGVVSIIYTDLPEPGYITGLTYGLSLVRYPDWRFGRPELCICVESKNFDWGKVAGFLANGLRGNFPFRYGEVINFGEPINEESDMSAFFIFAPSIFAKEYYWNIDVGTNYKINIAGLYPIYPEEQKVLREIGIEKFWYHPNFELYKLNRNKVTSEELPSDANIVHTTG